MTGELRILALRRDFNALFAGKPQIVQHMICRVSDPLRLMPAFFDRPGRGRRCCPESLGCTLAAAS